LQKLNLSFIIVLETNKQATFKKERKTKMTDERLGKEIIEIFKKNLKCETNEEVLEAITDAVFWAELKWSNVARGGGKNEDLKAAREIEMDFCRIWCDLKDLAK
jgi:hypothetical protein